ncbi:hypothetical protein [Galbitalea soli]|uniref:Uncharacterized protein n=1 Tax=Galbitalea soli TaxID=1268042 RepID=A0A7C9TQK3_9MICO|nr:hypothetical protein [Galbitalea soli]NEM90762.1 hypothetical protein [Galbitalea soli]NYJ31480.1 hypothetical protein [Galbitalea soli]
MGVAICLVLVAALVWQFTVIPSGSLWLALPVTITILALMTMIPITVAAPTKFRQRVALAELERQAGAEFWATWLLRYEARKLTNHGTITEAARGRVLGRGLYYFAIIGGRLTFWVDDGDRFTEVVTFLPTQIKRFWRANLRPTYVYIDAGDGPPDPRPIALKSSKGRWKSTILDRENSFIRLNEWLLGRQG